MNAFLEIGSYYDAYASLQLVCLSDHLSLPSWSSRLLICSHMQFSIIASLYMPPMKHLPDVSGTLLVPVVLLSSRDPVSALYLLHLMLNFTLINWLQDSAPWVLLLSYITSSSLNGLNFLSMYMGSKHGSPRTVVLLSSGPWCAAMHLEYSLSYQLGIFTWTFPTWDPWTSFFLDKLPFSDVCYNKACHSLPNPKVSLRHFTLAYLPCIHCSACCQATITSQQLESSLSHVYSYLSKALIHSP